MINNLNFNPHKTYRQIHWPTAYPISGLLNVHPHKTAEYKKISPQPFLIAGTFVFYSVKSSLLLLRSISESYHTVEVNLIEQLVGSTHTLYRKTVCRNLVTLDKS